MIDDEIHDDLYIALSSFLKKLLHILHGAIFRIDGAVICDIVAMIVIGTGIDGRKPESTNTKVFEIVEFGYNALQVADAIIVSVAKAAGINLIDDAILPPLASWHAYVSGVHKLSIAGKLS